MNTGKFIRNALLITMVLLTFCTSCAEPEPFIETEECAAPSNLSDYIQYAEALVDGPDYSGPAYRFHIHGRNVHRGPSEYIVQGAHISSFIIEGTSIEVFAEAFTDEFLIDGYCLAQESPSHTIIELRHYYTPLRGAYKQFTDLSPGTYTLEFYYGANGTPVTAYVDIVIEPATVT